MGEKLLKFSIYNWFLGLGSAPKGHFESKILVIHTISQNRLNTIDKLLDLLKFWKLVLESYLTEPQKFSVTDINKHTNWEWQSSLIWNRTNNNNINNNDNNKGRTKKLDSPSFN